MISSYCLNMSLCNNHENNETNISFYNILLNACAKGTCQYVVIVELCSVTAADHLMPISNPIVCITVSKLL